MEGKKGGHIEELLSCSFPDIRSEVQGLSWRSSPAELLSFSPMGSRLNQVFTASFFLGCFFFSL